MDAEINCCMNCEKREVGCHGICEEYLSARKARDEYLKERHKREEEKQITKDYIHDAFKRARKGRR